MSKTQIQHRDQHERLVLALHLDIESFYIFAKVLLDKVALFIERYFGQVRGVRLLSHARLSKHLGAYVDNRGITLPDDIESQIKTLKATICDYRDKQISHHYNLHSVRGTFTPIFGIGGSKIIPVDLRPQSGDTATESEDLGVLLPEIDRYLGTVLSMISENRERTVLEIRE